MLYNTRDDFTEVLGLRMNNPLNIKLNGIQWDGMTNYQDHKIFVRFKSPEWGIRAAARILNTYSARGLDTIREIVSTWAPPSDNNPTEKYVKNVGEWTGIDVDEVIGREEYPAILAAMIRMENGYNPFSTEFIKHGVDLAYV